MTQMKLGASQVGGRLFKSVATSALALSALAGGIIFQTNEAHAFRCTFLNGVVSNCDGGLNPYTEWVDSNPASDKELMLINTSGLQGTGSFDWDWVDLDGSGSVTTADEWFTEFDWEPDLVGPKTGEISYKLRIKPGVLPDWYFSSASLKVIQSNVPNGSIVDNIYSDASLTNLIGTMAAPPSDQAIPLPNKYREIWVHKTWSIPAGSAIDTITQDYHQTPGPLPILGAGAAFGFSRKLRGRIKAARIS